MEWLKHGDLGLRAKVFTGKNVLITRELQISSPIENEFLIIQWLQLTTKLIGVLKMSTG